MFYHVKELEFDARVSAPDPRFARLLLEQFGGGNGELKAALQYFIQAFTTRMPYPDKYDMLMDIATEEFSHLEIVGATITMLLEGVNGELKNAAEQTYLTRLVGDGGSGGRPKMMDEMLHTASTSPTFLVLTGGGPALTNSDGQYWTGAYINANGDLTVDLRSNIAAESRAKIVYEYLLQFTEDPLVQETLRFLMTREVAHFQQFSAALETIQPNFPPGVLQGDPRFSHMYVNASQDGGENARGPWNQGQGPWPERESWNYVEDPIEYVMETHGLTEQKIEGSMMDPKMTEQKNKQVSQMRSKEVKTATKQKKGIWSEYEM